MAGVRDGGEALEISRPPWKRAVLAQLELEGPGANLEVGLGGPQHVEPRLLAAARVLAAVQPSEVQGLGADVLGRWDRWDWLAALWCWLWCVSMPDANVCGLSSCCAGACTPCHSVCWRYH
jgi:hypothetical protein